jgi:hypothetical protein
MALLPTPGPGQAFSGPCRPRARDRTRRDDVVAHGGAAHRRDGAGLKGIATGVCAFERR